MAIDRSFLDSIYSKRQNDIKYNLDNIKALSRLFNDPHRQMNIIHVTGTNGKGSTCAILESLLIASGKKTGLFTSPHLVSYNERFRINRNNISDGKLIRYVKKILKVSEKAGIEPSFFEISTMTAMLYFRDEGVDWAILEVGLGGRLDATNIVNPALSVITMIDKDHKRLLGRNKTLIASEKAAIVKNGKPFITGDPSPRIRDHIIREGLRRGGYLPKEPSIKTTVKDLALGSTDVSVFINGEDQGSYKLMLGGPHQAANLNLALRAYSIIEGVPSRKILKAGLKNVVWEGRMSIVSDSPLIILDGCHNKSGAIGVRQVLDSNLHKIRGRKILLFGMVKKKPLNEVSALIFPIFDHVYATGFDSVRARDPLRYVKYLEKYSKKYTIINSPEELSKRLRLASGDLLLVTGSLYLLGEFLKEKVWQKLS